MTQVAGAGKAERSALAARRRYFPALEGMRAVAALTVLFGHVLILSHMWSDPFGRVYDLGMRIAPLGVIIFFAISGFLIYRPFIAARVAGHSVRALVSGYGLRRAVRILPAYWVAITLLALGPGVHEAFGGHWWVVYGLLQIYSPDGWGMVGISPAWSLCVEVTFYMCLPLVALLLQSRGVHSAHRHELRWELGTLAFLALLSLTLRMIFVLDSDDGGFLGGTLIGTFGWFTVGMAIAALEISPSRALDRARGLLANPTLCWGAAALLFAVWASSRIPAGGEHAALNRLGEEVLVIAFAGLVLAPAVFGEGRAPVRLSLTNRPMVYLGTISYGIYLYHFTVAEWLGRQEFVTGIGSFTLSMLVLALAAVIVLASLSWFLVEKPLMTMVKSIKAIESPIGKGTGRGQDRRAKAIAEPAP